MVGADDGGLRFFENIRNALAPAYLERTGGGNPFEGFDAGASTVADVFADGFESGDLRAWIPRNDL